MKIVAVVTTSERIENTTLAVSNLEQAAMILGEDIKVEAVSPSGVKNALDVEDIKAAYAVIVAADESDVNLFRFKGKPLRTVSVKDATHHAKTLIQDAQTGKFETYKA